MSLIRFFSCAWRWTLRLTGVENIYFKGYLSVMVHIRWTSGCYLTLMILEFNFCRIFSTEVSSQAFSLPGFSAMMSSCL